MIVLLFHQDRTFLGEFCFEDGALQRSLLSREGEERIGQTVQHWHQSGIPCMRMQETRQGSTISAFVSVERIPASSKRAYEAFLTWADDRQFVRLDLPERLFSYWQRLLTLSLEPEERFISFQAMRNAPHRLLSAWDQALNQLAQPV